MISWRSKLVVLLAALLLAAGGLYAQSPRFTHLGAEEGFPQSIVYQLGEDTTGNLWLATEDGILRYNSRQTYAYRQGRGLPEGFAGSLRVLTVGPEGEIWVGSSRALARYSAAADRFDAVAVSEPGPSSLRALLQAPDGQLWIGAFNGLWRYDPAGGRFDRIAPVRSVEGLLLDGDYLFFGAEDGLYRFDLQRGDYTKVSTVAGVTALAVLEEGYLLGTKTGGLYRTRADAASPGLVMDFAGSPIRKLLRRESGGWFVGVDGGGIQLLAEDLSPVARYRNDVDDGQSLASDGVYDLLTDQSGILWVATYGGGLNKLDPYANAFIHIDHEVNTERGLKHPFTRAVLEDERGRIWFGTKDGVSVWYPASGDWRQVPLERRAGYRPIVTGLAATDGTVWATTYQGQLYRIDGSSLRADRVTYERAPADRNGNLFSIVRAPDGALWFGGVNTSLYRLDPATGASAVVSVPLVRTLVAGPDGQILAGTRDGLRRIEWRGGAAGARIGSVEAVQAYQDHQPFGTVNAVLPASDGSLYLGTDGAGILRYEPQTERVTGLTANAELPSLSVQSLLFDATGDLWAGTSRGLAHLRLTAADTTVRVYTKADGLLSTEFNYGSALRLRDGRLLFGGPEGVTLFDPAALGRRTDPPPVVLEELFLLNDRQEPGSAVLPVHLSRTKELRLAHDQNALTLHFAAIAPAAGRVDYRWQLSGLTDGWTQPSDLAQASFTNLEPGQYTFRVQAASRPGEWGPARALELRVAPPWWRTGWAYLVYVLLGLAAAYVLFRVSRSLIQRRNAERQIDFFNNITHELKTPLAILLASLEDVTEGEGAGATETKGKIRATVKRLNALFEQLLNFHKASSTGKSRHVSAFDPGRRARELSQRFRPLLTERELTLEVSTAGAPPVFHYDRDIFDKILFNLLSNAVKYSRAGGAITVGLGAAGGRDLELRVADTGIGIPADQQKYILREYYRARNAVNSQLPGTGLGLMMVKSMVEKEGGSIRFTSKENVGTTFTVTMTDRAEDLRIKVDPEAALSPALTTSPAPAAAPEEATSGLEAAQILLVEDNDELRASLAKRLGQHFRVITASDGRAGLEKAREVFPDLIITDLIMPEMDGMELSRAVQEDIQLNHIPVYLLTVLHNSAQKVESIAAGVTEYLEKPVQFDLLLAKITNTLSWRQRMRERYAAQDESDRALSLRSDREAEFIGGLEQFMAERMADDSLSVQDLCEHVGMSRTSLYMKMKNLIDLSPQDFIIHARLKEARRMLAETDEPIKAVAYDCGFSNPKYFSTSFKGKYGVSPSAFRRSLG